MVFSLFLHKISKPKQMKNHKTFLYAMLSIGLLGMCSCGSKVKWPALPIEEATPYFVEAAKTKAIDTAFYEVKDTKGNKLGTILFSSPYSDGVKGFNGPTPLLIALDADGRIKNIVLLENQETPNFAKRVVEGGLYEAWNGFTVDEALGKDVDAISGATYTSNGVKKSLVARLKAYQKQLKK
jgi:Na+-translocating ferredoxin:NAD+ oxidoreductase RnfG subunit